MIKLYVGNLGAGKTLHMVKDLMEQMKRGRKVISNTPIRFIEEKRWKDKKGIIHNTILHESITLADSKSFLEAIINARDAILAVDELAVFFPSNFWSKISGELIYKFAQSRKMRTDFYGTTQGWGHTIKRIRDLTNQVVMCSRKRFFLPLPYIHRWIDKNTGKKKWRLGLKRPILFRGTAYWPDFFYHKSLDRKKWKYYQIYQDMIYPSEAKRIFSAYNTYFRIKGSALTKMQGIIENYEAKSSDNIELLKEDTYGEAEDT